MGLKIALAFAVVCLALACAAEARNPYDRPHHSEGHEGVGGRRTHLAAAAVAPRRGLSPKKGRVFPGAVAIKKLVLLKFKKVIPISLILLKSSNENEAELVPVYPNSEIPANVQFIPTPNGISGHKDVQAIAIPTELHQQLAMNGLANIEDIEALLNEAEEEQQLVAAEAPATAAAAAGSQKDDEPLNVDEKDEDQLLEGASQEMPAAGHAAVRRIPVEEVAKPVLRGVPQTAVEEIPLFLYSAKDTPKAPAAHRRRAIGRRHYFA